MIYIHVPKLTLSPEQCRAARAVLKLTVQDVCAVAGMGPATLVKFEAGGEVRASSAERLRELFEARGLTFASDGNGLAWPSSEAPS